MTEKQTAGHDNFGEFAPKFAELNDDVLFGQVWSRESKLSAKERSLITVTSLLTQGMFGPLEYHMQKAKENGVSKAEMVEAITQLAFYSGGLKLGQRWKWPRKFMPIKL